MGKVKWVNMLHLSDIRKWERCERCFWLSTRKPKAFTPFVNVNENIYELVKQYFDLTDAFEGEANDDADKALNALETKNALLNARFSYRDLRIKVPLLLKKKDGFAMIMIYRLSFPKEKEAQAIADMLYVLQKCGVPIVKVSALHLNGSYTRMGSLNVKELFVESDCLYNSKNKAHKTIAELVKDCYRDLDPILDELHGIVQKDEIPPKRKAACTRGGKCLFYEDCFQEKVDDDSLLHLMQSAHKLSMLSEGKETMQEVDIERLEGTRQQYAQVMAARLHGCYVDKPQLRLWLRTHIQYPISYLDFEWETFVFPPYDKMKPFDVLAFQYSLHIEQQDGTLTHTGFIGEKDCREEFILSLLANIPKNGTILVFNMEGAEKLRLIQLANQFPQYEESLRQIWERMVDLSLPFASGTIYDLRQRGGYSLKRLVSIFSDYHYADLDISIGMDAVEKWRRYSMSEDAGERAEIYHQLEEYCAMDTYAEYIVYHALRNIVT